MLLLSELKVKMLLFFKYNYFLKRKTAINVFYGFLAVEQKYLHGWKAEMSRFYIYKLLT
jgi:heme O synthase-like polyprenyltransferase